MRLEPPRGRQRSGKRQALGWMMDLTLGFSRITGDGKAAAGSAATSACASTRPGGGAGQLARRTGRSMSRTGTLTRSSQPCRCGHVALIVAPRLWIDVPVSAYVCLRDVLRLRKACRAVN